MIDTIPAHPAMLRLLDLQPAQRLVSGAMTEADLLNAMRSGTAIAAVEAGRVLAIGGVFSAWEGRGVVWGLLSADIGAAMLPIHRAVIRGLAASPYRRLEAHVEASHVEGHRWITALGFDLEGVMRQFWQGRDYALYSRIRG